MTGNQEGLLGGYRILDLTDAQGFLCGKILADLGAEVIKIERPGGDPSRNIGPFYHDIPDPQMSLYWWAYNANKWGITLSLECAEGKKIFKKLVQKADVIVESFPPGTMDKLGFSYAILSTLNPRVIMTSITPFGQEGPYKDFVASDVIVMAMGGWAYLCGELDREPVVTGFPQSFLCAAGDAAVGTMIALYEREQSGKGQHVDVSAQQSVVMDTVTAIPFWVLNNEIIKRSSPYRVGLAKKGVRQRYLWRCKDGFVIWATLGGMAGARENRILVNWMAKEGMASDFLKQMDWENWDIQQATTEFFEQLEKEVGAFFLRHTKKELFEAALKENIILYPVSEVKELMENAQLKARDFWVKGLGGVFEDIHVLDFSWVAAGPIHTKYLADFGATVVRIESANRPDILRYSAPFKDHQPGLNRSGYYAIYNTNKLSMSLDLKHPRAKEIVEKLVSWADVVAESFTPGTMEGWGLGYEDLKKIKPDIIMFRTCQLGQTGPMCKQPGYGPMLVAYSGLTNITGWPDRFPVQPYGAHSDFVAPRTGTTALIAALLYRRKTGQGQCLDLSQLEASIHFLAPLFLDYAANRRQMPRKGNTSSYGAPCGIFRCQGEDQWCAIEILSDEAWEAFCRLTPELDWPRDPKFVTAIHRKENEKELNKLLESWTINFTTEELMARLQSAGIIAGIVKNPKELLADAQLNHYQFFWWMEHPEIGRFPYHGQAMKLSRTPCQPRLPSPCLGQHTEYVCCEILGMSREEFVAHLKEGVFGKL